MKNKIWVYILVALGFVAIGVIGWQTETDMWDFGLICAVVAFVILVAGVFDQARATIPKVASLSDLLDASLHVLDANGLEVQVAAGTENGCCILIVNFQNRFMGPASSTLLLESSDKHSREKIVARFQIECPGGGAGSTSISSGIPKAKQGSEALFGVKARTVYPTGRIGEARQFRGFIVPRLGKTRDSVSIALATSIAIMVSPLLFISAVLGSQPTCRIPVSLPEGVQSHAIPTQSPVVISWIPKETFSSNVDSAVEEDGNPFRSPSI